MSLSTTATLSSWSALDRLEEPADHPYVAVVTIDRPVLEALVAGRLNAQAALLRGLVTCQGSMAALMTFQRCLPGPPGSKGRVAPVSSTAVMAQHDAKHRRPM